MPLKPSERPKGTGKREPSKKKARAESAARAVPPAVKSKPVKDEFRCARLGDELRRVECPSCSGNVQIKVMSCELHGECQLTARIPGVKSCNGCKDKIRPTPQAEPLLPIISQETSPPA